MQLSTSKQVTEIYTLTVNKPQQTPEDVDNTEVLIATIKEVSGAIKDVKLSDGICDEIELSDLDEQGWQALSLISASIVDKSYRA